MKVLGVSDPIIKFLCMKHGALELGMRLKSEEILYINATEIVLLFKVDSILLFSR